MLKLRARIRDETRFRTPGLSRTIAISVWRRVSPPPGSARGGGAAWAGAGGSVRAAPALALVKIRATDSNRAEILQLVELSKGRVVDLAPEAVIVEVTGPEADIDAFVALVRTYGIKELVRTGAVVMSRGSSSIEEAVKR